MTLADCNHVCKFKPIDLLGEGNYTLIERSVCTKCKRGAVVKRAMGRRTDTVEMLLNEFFILELLADVPGLPRPITFGTRSAAFDIFVGRDFLEYLIDIGSPNYDRLSVMYLFENVFKTLADIHSHGIVHGDIKLENILVNHADNSATLIDFGHASVFRIGTREFKIPIKLGTPGYFPPEHRILARTDAQSPSPDKCDSWGLGASLYIAIHACIPTTEENVEEYSKYTDDPFVYADYSTFYRLLGQPPSLMHEGLLRFFKPSDARVLCRVFAMLLEPDWRARSTVSRAHTDFKQLSCFRKKVRAS